MFFTDNDFYKHILDNIGDNMQYVSYIGQPRVYLHIVKTPDGDAVFVSKEKADAFAKENGFIQTERLGILTERGTAYLLDQNNPEIRLGIPESQEAIKKKALNKLTEKERKALGL